MAKQAKLKQTDYTIGGRNVSNTAIPLWQDNLTRMGEYLDDPTQRMDMYLDRYYNADNVNNQDFLRQYNRAMNQRTGANYASTGGGYSSSGQRAYDDLQRYQNDLASRLRNAGIQSSYNMASGDFGNMLNANTAFQNAYGQGATYSQIDQQNDLNNQINKNWWSGAMQSAGNALMNAPNPWAKAIGAGLTTAGGAFALDTTNAQNQLATMYGQKGGGGAGYNTNNQTFQNALDQINQFDWNGVGSYFGNLFGGKTQTSSLPIWYQNARAGE